MSEIDRKCLYLYDLCESKGRTKKFYEFKCLIFKVTSVYTINLLNIFPERTLSISRNLSSTICLNFNLYTQFHSKNIAKTIHF
ncbi:hypothetical protein TNCV_3924631 [Trichonephila clavipes]|nr:hypothetical protein TNCV_3924631 [Trichonephila clavipes]